MIQIHLDRPFERWLIVLIENNIDRPQIESTGAPVRVMSEF